MKSDFVLFLVGSVLPLYCAGYAGLIHITRTDPDLYGVIEAHARRLIVSILGGVAACAALFVLANWRNEDNDWTLFMMVVPPLLLVWHAWYSRSFFSAIAATPRQKSGECEGGSA